MAQKRLPKSKLSSSAKYYREHPEAAAKKAQTDSEINSRPEQLAKRRELSKIRYKAEKDGKDLSGKDYDHHSKKFVKMKTNRGRKGEGNR